MKFSTCDWHTGLVVCEVVLLGEYAFEKLPVDNCGTRLVLRRAVEVSLSDVSSQQHHALASALLLSLASAVPPDGCEQVRGKGDDHEPMQHYWLLLDGIFQHVSVELLGDEMESSCCNGILKIPVEERRNGPTLALVLGSHQLLHSQQAAGDIPGPCYSSMWLLDEETPSD
jgi:hypothetical protein